MKKVISLILISVMLIAVSTTIFASESVLGDNNNNSNDNETTTITGNEYQNAQNNTENTNTNNNANKNNTSLPQTGIEDYGTGILLVICLASTVFAYKKVSDYRNI